MVNLPDSVTIQVTQKDIDAGSRLKSHCCPIARAGRRAFNGYECIVDGELRVCRGGKTWFYEMADYAQAWMKWFDHDGEVEPFEFTAKKRSA